MMQVQERMDKDAIDSGRNVEDLLRLLICSDLRRQLVLSLGNGKATVADLRAQVGVSSAAAIHALRELEKQNVTYQDDKRQYLLTNIGQIMAAKIGSFTDTVGILDQHRKFWLEHDLTGIPQTSLRRLGCLKGSHLITSSPTEVYKVFSTFTTLLGNANEIRGVSPIFFPDLIDVFVGLVAKGKKPELVVTREVLDKMLELTDRNELQKALEATLKLFVIEYNPKIAFTVTDYVLTMGLFRWDGTYDDTSDLLCYTSDGLRWGEKLFAHYVAECEAVVLEK